MKTIKILSLLFIVAGISFSCKGEENNDTNTSEEKVDEVNVYYFHLTRRCATCKTVEAEAKKAVKELYGDKIEFASYNIEKPEGEKKAEEIGGVSGQALLIVSGDKKINITNEGFMYARSKPDKLKQTIKEKIESLK